MKPAAYLFAYTMPVFLLLGAWLGGLGVLLPTVVVFVLLPLLDALSGEDHTEPIEGDRSPLFDLWLRAWFPVQTAVLVIIGSWVASGAYSPVEIVGLIGATGVVVSGTGITVAHELMHRRPAHDRALAELLMLTALYPWFCVEHVQGHHKTVSTPDDPAFAARGRSLYAYLPHTLVGGLRSAWAIETRRVNKRGIRGLADRRVRYALSLGALLSAVAVLGGPWVLVWFVGQAAFAATLLETINYIEHYGLHRRRNSRGKWERVQADHSWNTPSRLTNWYLFNLQRHADHHAFAARPYDQLRNLPTSPTLPAGYPTMILIALVPPLWFRIVHPLIDARQHSASVPLTAG